MFREISLASVNKFVRNYHFFLIFEKSYWVENPRLTFNLLLPFTM